MKIVLASSVAAITLAVTVAWAGVMGNSPDRRGVCVSADDVLWHQANSREGISLTCTTDMLPGLPSSIDQR